MLRGCEACANVLVLLFWGIMQIKKKENTQNEGKSTAFFFFSLSLLLLCLFCFWCFFFSTSLPVMSLILSNQ